MEIFELERGEASMFVPIASNARAVGRTAMTTIPAAELALTEHRGPHHDMDVTYGALGAYVAAHAIGVEGPVRESYLVDTRTPPRAGVPRSVGLYSACASAAPADPDG